MKLYRVLYSAEVQSTGGRSGKPVSSDERLNLKLDMPKELGGGGENPTAQYRLRWDVDRNGIAWPLLARFRSRTRET